jgi:lipoprotein NlpI
MRMLLGRNVLEVLGFVGVTALLGLTASALAEDSLRSASDYVSRGMERFRSNEVAASIGDFERAAKLDPQAKPHLWQLGISHYYADNFQQGRQLFELHQNVNRNDVENAAWHFICVARADNIETARKNILEIDVARDVRVPMREVYQFYAGGGTEAAILAAAQQADTEVARMYAHLYLGLYYEVAGKVDRARDYLRQSAAAKLEQHYMCDVAKVHLLQRQWNP